jgi:hypothetical protein
LTDEAQTDGDAAGDERRSVRRALRTVPGAIGATATLITGVLGVVFLLIPSWRPLSRDQVKASLTVPAVETNVSVVEWANRQYPGDPAGALARLIGHKPAAEDTAYDGLVVYVSLQADGFKNRAIRLRARVYDAATQRRDPQQNPEQMTYPKAGELKIDAPSRSSIQLLLLNDFSDIGGRYFVRVEAYDDDGILAYADSDEIPYRRSAAKRPA